MNYLTLNSVLHRHKLALFTLIDLRHLFPNESEKTIQNNLTRWLARKYCERLRRGVYQLLEPWNETDIPDLYIANRLYEPSYVSLETALSHYSMIPEVAVQVTSVTTRPTRTFRNQYGSFFYRTCKVEAFVGYRLILYEGFKISIADQEKALVDFLYFHSRSEIKVNCKEERLNKAVLRKLDWGKARRYSRHYGKNVIESLQACLEYARC